MYLFMCRVVCMYLFVYITLSQVALLPLEGLLHELRTNPGVPLLTASGQASPVVVVDLASTMTRILQPTLNGLLLAYPVVYFIEGGMPGAAAAARCLSSQHLTLFKMTAAPPPALAVALAKAGMTEAQEMLCKGRKKKDALGSSGMAGKRTDVVCCFTVPACMCSRGDDAVGVVSHIDAWAVQVSRNLHAYSFDCCECTPSSVGTCAVCL